MSDNITGNREYKDTAFRLLFGDRSKSAELYNAIAGTNYAPNALTMNTIQNPFFFGVLRNDLSFTVEDRLIVLMEHNSSVNPNMGLRFLLYIADLYEITMDKKAMYKSKAMSIAKPEFYMLYNGKEEYPEKAIVKLSDLFKVQDRKKPNLELVVTVYNANKGYNKKIMQRSKTLDEYAEFVAVVRSYTDILGLALTEALKRAIEDCIKNNVLLEFLQKYGGEIVNMLYREWNLEDAMEVRAEERGEEIAENMLKKNKYSVEEISEITELTIAKITALKERLDATKK